jgi:hypothetical protein
MKPNFQSTQYEKMMKLKIQLKKEQKKLESNRLINNPSHKIIITLSKINIKK